MSLLLTCPVPSELTDIPVPTCFEDFGQISKALLQRLYSSGTTLNKFTIATANPNAKASWDPLIAASDNTKVTICPQINNSDLQPGDEVTFGGGDATVGGAEKIVAVNPSTFTGELHRQRQDVIEALKTYMGEIIGVNLVSEYGFAGGLVDDIVAFPAHRLPAIP